MSAIDHDHAQLGAYVLGALDADEANEFEAHLARCAQCRREVAELRALTADLNGVPPEAFFDGPQRGGDLLLQRTLRSVRESEPRGRSRLAVVAGAAVLVVVAPGGRPPAG